ncbi:NAD(P)-dependent oxidoreductase [Gemmatimonas aurantiaca]|nr:NAD(P)-dependent oxidoreductase [Gemmatimonas aurantiaca]
MKNPKRILLTGAGGMLGMRLVPRLAAAFRKATMYAVFHAPPDSANQVFDCSAIGNLTENKFLDAVLEQAKPDTIVNLAALTDVELCEREPVLAQSANTELVRYLLEATPSAKFVQLSTDYVFDGVKGNYHPRDAVSEQSNHSVYGKTKLNAEKLVLSDGNQNNNVVIRTSGIYDWLNAKNLFSFFLRSLSEGKKTFALSDCHYSPIWADDLAQGLIGLLKAGATGMQHYGGAERMHRLQFAKTIADVFQLDASLIVPRILADFNWRAIRPADSSLDSEASYALAKVAPKSLALALAEIQLQLSSKDKALTATE